MQFLIAILSETKLVIGILLALAIHGIAQGAIPTGENRCGSNIISLDNETTTITEVCHETTKGRTSFLTLTYANGKTERYTVVTDSIVRDLGTTVTRQLTLKSISPENGNLNKTFSVAETVAIGDKNHPTEDGSVLQIRGSLNNVSFDVRSFSKPVATPPALNQTETL